MRYLGLLILDHRTEKNEAELLLGLGFRRRLATDDKSFAFQLPYPGWSTERTGDSPEQVRDEIMTELADNKVTAFVIVAERFSCGRT